MARSYAAEYARRKELAAQRGLSTAQARGHARPGEAKVSALKEEGLISRRADFEQRAYRAASRIERGEVRSLRQAARSEGISSKALGRFNKERFLLVPNTPPDAPMTYKPKPSDGWKVGYRANLSVFTPDVLSSYVVATFDYRTTKIIAKYENAIKQALNGDSSRLKQFSGTVVYDVQGNSYKLETSIDTIRLILSLMTDEEQNDYEQSFYHAQVTANVQRAA